jgi:hypothetical protein
MKTTTTTLTPALLRGIDAYWHADETLAGTRRAIERWENEGGEIPSSTRGAGSGDGVERKPKPPVQLPFSGYTP